MCCARYIKNIFVSHVFHTHVDEKDMCIPPVDRDTLCDIFRSIYPIESVDFQRSNDCWLNLPQAKAEIWMQFSQALNISTIRNNVWILNVIKIFLFIALILDYMCTRFYNFTYTTFLLILTALFILETLTWHVNAVKAFNQSLSAIDRMDSSYSSNTGHIGYSAA